MFKVQDIFGFRVDMVESTGIMLHSTHALVRPVYVSAAHDVRPYGLAASLLPLFSSYMGSVTKCQGAEGELVDGQTDGHGDMVTRKLFAKELFDRTESRQLLGKRGSGSAGRFVSTQAPTTPRGAGNLPASP